VAVFPTLPQRISRLYDLAYNLWWSWTPEAQALYADLDPELWRKVNHNPVRLLAELDPAKLEAAAEDKSYLKRFDAVIADWDSYMGREDTWYQQTYPNQTRSIVYFSAEFGLHESLPIYSGGLGVLAGDHVKEASDLGLPFVGIGFLYPQGYFTQRITRDGTQEAYYDKLTFSEVAARPALGADGREIVISVDLPGRTVYAKVWKLQIGRVPLYLMDTDVHGNAPSDRELSARLYGGNQELRISQEIVLGIGGLRVVRALGLDPAVLHMNDSHPVFMVLERARELVQHDGLSFDVAREVVRSSTVFTTHTPVPAGNEVFGYDLIDKYFSNYWPQLGLSRDQFHDLARQQMPWGNAFSMTVLALRFSSLHNGVSKLHGAVARRMWHFLWAGTSVDDVPITHITNGVHTPTWLSPEMRDLYSNYLAKDWQDHRADPATWEPINDIPDAELWQAHNERKQRVIRYMRRHLREHRMRLGEGPQSLAETDTLGDPNALILGFARRFATYKRATLIFRDRERLLRLLNNPQRPVQIIFAGKSHPADEPGKALIREIYNLSRSPEFAGKIIFLENYDMDMARHLVSGVDVWLNNPIRPHEASGTSGMKAALNGVPNCSILDGWWDEGYNGKNGWAIGEQREYQDQETQDTADANALYETLEREVIPVFFERNKKDVPQQWLAIMKEAIRSCAPRFSMTRQVQEYTERLYIPTAERSTGVCQAGFEKARSLAAWKQHVRAHWNSLGVQVQGPRDTQLGIGEPIDVTATLYPGGLRPDDLDVELVLGRDDDGVVRELAATELRLMNTQPHGEHVYSGSIATEHGGSVVYGVRIVPAHPDLATKYELGLIKWA
jgi:starch phosphorylase